MKKIVLFLVSLVFFIATACFAGSVTIKWDASQEATGYKVYASYDLGTTWDDGTDVGNVTEYVYEVPDEGWVMFMISAYNESGEVRRMDSGVWVNKALVLPFPPQGVGVE